MSAAIVPAVPSTAPTRSFQPVVALLGNPNSGKTTLFNALTGARARAGNYPGVTVDVREAVLPLSAGPVRILDLPGTYSTVPRAEDEAVALDGLLGRLAKSGRPDLVVAVVDATNLERNLYLVAQLRELGGPLVVALTMMDTIESDGQQVRPELLEERLGVPVVPVASVRPGGTDALVKAIDRALAEPVSPAPVPVPVSFAPALVAVGETVASESGWDAPAEALAAWALTVHAAAGDDLGHVGPNARAALEKAATTSDLPSVVERLATARYARIREWLDGVVGGGRDSEEAPSARLTARIDRIALHPLLGPVTLVLVFGALFQALFSWSSPVMDGIEAAVGWLSTLVVAEVPESMPLVRSLVADGFFAGVGAVVVFVPQIAVLFLFLGILEDSGYLARAAFLLDRVMAKTGLHGRAFVPLLSGFACAVPAVMATRTIENKRDRLVAILVTPLVSCSARLPVYGLMIATVFATQAPVFGLFHPGAVVMVSMYGLSIVAALGMAALFKRTLLKSPPPPFVLELPLYRMPRAGQLARHVGGKVRSFLVEAGTLIFAITIVLWGLFKFPAPADLDDRRAAAVAQAEATIADEGAREEAVAELEAAFDREALEHSIAGRLGRAIEPVIEPLGFDWKIGVGLLASFAAREVLVATLGLVYGLGDGADEESLSLRDAMRADTHPVTGAPIHTPLSGLALMVFFVLAMQCMSTLAAVRRETRGWRWPAFQFGYMTVLAWVGAFVVFQGGKLLGFG